MKRIEFLCTVVVAVVSYRLDGAAFTNPRMTTAAPPTGSSCGSLPPDINTFVTTDNMAYLYFDATISAGEQLTNDWVAPDGTVLAGGSWNATAGSYCFTGASLRIDQTPAARLGTWRARVFSNGSLLFSVTFRILAPSGTSVPNPDATALNGPLPESPHPYSDNYDHTWTYTLPGAASLAISFDGSTWTESCCDNIFVSDATGQGVVGSPFRGNALAGQTLNVPGATVKIRFVTDYSVVGWGFRVTSVTAGSGSAPPIGWVLNPNVDHIGQPEKWACGPTTVAMWAGFVNRATYNPYDISARCCIATREGGMNLSQFMQAMYDNTAYGYVFSSWGYTDKHAAVKGIMWSIARFREPVAIVGGDVWLYELFGRSSGTHYLLVRGGRADQSPFENYSEENHIRGVWVNDSTENSPKYSGPVSGMYKDREYSPDRLMEYWGRTGALGDGRYRSIERACYECWGSQGQSYSNNDVFKTY